MTILNCSKDYKPRFTIKYVSKNITYVPLPIPNGRAMISFSEVYSEYR
jgi:hypothetical protein